jgi:hypothetical protein
MSGAIDALAATAFATEVANDFQFPAAGPSTTRWLWFFKSDLSHDGFGLVCRNASRLPCLAGSAVF